MAKKIASITNNSEEMIVYEDRIIIQPSGSAFSALTSLPGASHGVREFLICDIESIDHRLPSTMRGAGRITFNIRHEAQHKYGVGNDSIIGSIYKGKAHEFLLNDWSLNKKKYAEECEAFIKNLAELINKQYTLEQPAQTSQPQSSSVDRIAKLKDLAQMKTDGHITDAEFETYKAQIMGN
jgi:hypothetical protein